MAYDSTRFFVHPVISSDRAVFTAPDGQQVITSTRYEYNLLRWFSPGFVFVGFLVEKDYYEGLLK